MNFMNSRLNLTILQCILYFIVGWVMGSYLSFGQMCVMFIVLFGIQLITHVKAISDGIMFNQMMNDNPGLKRMLDKIKRDSEKN